MKISFDFDDTLSLPEVQEIAKSYVDKGYDVWVTTARSPESSLMYDNTEVERVCQEIGIPLDKIRYTNLKPKYLFLKGYDVHVDNDPQEIVGIQSNLPKTKAYTTLEFINNH
jgi:hypothetical protein